MFMYLTALAIIIFSIFGFTYSQSSLQAIRDDGGERTPSIQLLTFLHRTPLGGCAEAGVEGDNGIATNSSRQSLEISSQGMGESNGGQDRPQNDPYELQRIFEQKLKDANQIGLAESLWPRELQNDSEILKDLSNQLYASADTSKSRARKINTNPMFNLIRYETFKEAMAAVEVQQEQRVTTRSSTTNGQREISTENEAKSLLDEHNENMVTKDRNIE